MTANQRLFIKIVIISMIFNLNSILICKNNAKQNAVKRSDILTIERVKVWDQHKLSCVIVVQTNQYEC